jgi:hypothetical protein
MEENETERAEAEIISNKIIDIEKKIRTYKNEHKKLQETLNYYKDVDINIDNNTIDKLNKDIEKLKYNIGIQEKIKTLLIKRNLELLNKHGDTEEDKILDTRIRDPDRIKNIIGLLDDSFFGLGGSHLGLGRKKRKTKRYSKKRKSRKSRNKKKHFKK